MFKFSRDFLSFVTRWVQGSLLLLLEYRSYSCRYLEGFNPIKILEYLIETIVIHTNCNLFITIHRTLVRWIEVLNILTCRRYFIKTPFKNIISLRITVLRSLRSVGLLQISLRYLSHCIWNWTELRPAIYTYNMPIIFLRNNILTCISSKEYVKQYKTLILAK